MHNETDKVYTLHEYCVDDKQTILQLNTRSAEATSPMDSKRFQTLLSQGCNVLVAIKNKNVIAFIMSFYEGSDYDSENYRWFNQRLKNFVYVDRIVVAESARGRGIGQLLYTDLIEQAKLADINWAVAEINVQPPNEQSLVFHRKQGFVEVGQQGAGDKVVSMQLRAI